jgi:predicted AlkP superfamily phosphohydrolase/phosphomutase
VFAIARLVRKLLGPIGLLGVVRRVLKVSARKRVVRLGMRGREFAMLAGAVDWGRTLACAKSRSDCGIHVNLRGRHERGIVEPGEQCEKVVSDLMQALNAAKDPATGEKLVSLLMRSGDLYHGPHADEAPDLMILLQDGNLVVDTSLGGPLFCKHSKAAEHRMEGVLVMNGPGIRSGESRPAEIMDVAPTVLHSMGLPVPRYMEGQVLTRILRDDYLREHPVRHADVTLDECRRDLRRAEADQEGERTVRQRLRDLGYL